MNFASPPRPVVIYLFRYPAFRRLFLCALFAAAVLTSSTSFAQDNPPNPDKDFYVRVKSFALSGSATVNGLVLNRDRAHMTFTGTFYFAAPVDGHVTGAVFVGEGRFSAQPPANEFEQENVRRLLGADMVDSNFNTAVLRFSDDTFEQLNQKPAAAAVDPNMQRLATDTEARVLKETGANLSARIALSILNQEKPGFFFGSFDGGRRERFALVLDYQTRLPVANFGLNGGEKGLVYKYESVTNSPEIWLAFYGADDYKRGKSSYSDVNDLLDITHYDLDIDLRQNKKYVRLLAHVQAQTRFANLHVTSFQIGEDLGEFENSRLKKQLRLQKAKLGGSEIAFVQEDWEGGFTVFAPPQPEGAKVEFEFVLQGDFLFEPEMECDCHYPRSNSTWIPRHGYLDRATFDFTFHHAKKLLIASVGERLSEDPDPAFKDVTVTKYQIQQPVALVTFALAPFERHSQPVKWDKGGVGDPIPLEFNSLPGSLAAIKEDFIMAEMDNSLRYFTTLFGKYPYPTFGAAFHPFAFGQGFPTLLMIPGTDRASKRTYLFIAHETAHQWWGDIVSWRSYRDQWLSEGFAEYSGMLYTGLRAGQGAKDELISAARESLVRSPVTITGVGKGRLVDVGPIILGHRLNTSKTFGAYRTLIYNKGALVLRMLHYLLTDPESGNGDAFFAMMKDFVNQHRDGAASTDDFRRVANEHFAKSPIARAYGLTDLNWFFRQWVYQTAFPSYQLEYHFEDQPDGKVLLKGTVTQANAPANWFMVLPIAMTFGKQVFYTSVHANGPTAEFAIKLTTRPSKVELDPQHWILSERTSTKG